MEALRLNVRDGLKVDKSNIPVLILAGGLGTRLSEETTSRPKPMVEIGGKPILWHIMRYYSHFGFNNFVICAGYLSWAIKEFFSKLSWLDRSLDFTFGESGNSVQGIRQETIEPNHAYRDWRVRIIETGVNSMTGARVRLALDAIGISKGDTFALTYGDGLCDADLDEELRQHLYHGKIGTVLGVHPIARFGVLATNSANNVIAFSEKPQTTVDFINGGFFFFQGAFAEYLSTDPTCVLEREPLERLSQDRMLVMFRHDGFWHCMDTLRDKESLQALWNKQQCPWRIWEDR